MVATTPKKSFKAANAEQTFQDALRRLQRAIEREQEQVADAYRLWELQHEEQQVKQKLEQFLLYLNDDTEAQKKRFEKACTYWLKQNYGHVFLDWAKCLNSELDHQNVIKEFILRVIHYQLEQDALKRRSTRDQIKDVATRSVNALSNIFRHAKTPPTQTIDDQTKEQLSFLAEHFALTVIMQEREWKQVIAILDKTSLPFVTREDFKTIITEGYSPTLLPKGDDFINLRATIEEALHTGDYVYAVETIENYCEPKDTRSQFDRMKKKERHHNVFAAEVSAVRDNLQIPQACVLSAHREEQAKLDGNLSNVYKSIPRNNEISERYGLGSWVERLDSKLKNTLLADVNKSIDQYLHRGWWLSYKRLRYHTWGKGAYYAKLLKTQIESDNVKTYADACAVLLRYLRGEVEFHNQGKHSLKQRDYSLSTFLLKNLFSGIYATHTATGLNEDDAPMHVYEKKVDIPKHKKNLSDDEKTIVNTIQKPTYQYFGRGYNQASLFKSRESIRDTAELILETQQRRMRFVSPAA